MSRRELEMRTHDMIFANPRPELAALEVLLSADPRRSPWARIGPGLRPRHVQISRVGMDSRMRLELPIEGEGAPEAWRVGAGDLLALIRASADWREACKSRVPVRIGLDLGGDRPIVGGVDLWGERADDERMHELAREPKSISGSSLAVGLQIVADLGAPVALGHVPGEGAIVASIGKRAIAAARGLDCPDAMDPGVWLLVPAAGARALSLGVEGLLARGRTVLANCVAGLEVALDATELPESVVAIVSHLRPSAAAEPIQRADLAAALRACKIRGDAPARVRHGGEILDGSLPDRTGGALVRADDLAAAIGALSGAPRVSVLAHRIESSGASWLEISRTLGPGAVVTIAVAGLAEGLET